MLSKHLRHTSVPSSSEKSGVIALHAHDGVHSCVMHVHVSTLFKREREREVRKVCNIQR